MRRKFHPLFLFPLLIIHSLYPTISKAAEPSPTPTAPPSSSVLLDRLEASVGKSIIYHSDIERFRRSIPLRMQVDWLFPETPLAAKGKAATDSEIIDYLIDEKIILQQHPKTDAEVETEVNRIQTNIRMSRADLIRTLKEGGFDWETYFELIRATMAKRDFVEQSVRPNVNPRPNPSQGKKGTGAPGAARAYQLQIITATISSKRPEKVARQAIDFALESIKKGEPFSEVAKKISDAPNASSGGDLAPQLEREMDPEILAATKKLKEGEVSPVLGSARSGRYYLIRLVDITSAEEEEQLAKQEYQRQTHLVLDRLRQTIPHHRVGEKTLLLKE